jgi:hypothetical protein
VTGVQTFALPISVQTRRSRPDVTLRPFRHPLHHSTFGVRPPPPIRPTEAVQARGAAAESPPPLSGPPRPFGALIQYTLRFDHSLPVSASDAFDLTNFLNPNTLAIKNSSSVWLFHQQCTFAVKNVSHKPPFPQPPLLAVLSFFAISPSSPFPLPPFCLLCFPFLLFFISFLFSEFPLVPLGVRLIFLLCMTTSPVILVSVPPSLGPQNGILNKSPNANRRQSRFPTPHNITTSQHHKLVQNSIDHHSFSIEPDATSLSSLLLSIRLRFIVNRFHQAGRSR